jgi:hypothetical protein
MFRLPSACHGKERQLPPPANSGYFSFYSHESRVDVPPARLEKSPGDLAARFYIRPAFRIQPLAIAQFLRSRHSKSPRFPW